MLERIPQTKRVLDNASKQNRKTIKAAIPVQTPIVEGIRPDHFCEDFKAVAELLTFPFKPSAAIVRFAAEVADAWDALALPDKKSSGIHPVFFQDPNKLAANFFGTGGACSQRMGLLIHSAEKLQRELGVYRLLKRLREKEMTIKEFEEGMRRVGIEMDSVCDFWPERQAFWYTGKTASSKITANIPDLDKALAETESEELRLRLEIARRLSVGYNPAL